MTSLLLFSVQLAVLTLLSRALSLITRWLGQPLVIAEVLAGIALGPSLLGACWPAATVALFPASSLGVLKLLSHFGLVLFMFVVGLELDPKLLAGRARSSIVISHCSIVLPFALGAAAACWLHESYSTPATPLLAFALFMGAAMSITAFPVLARVLAERRLLSSRVGTISIACAAIDDATAWCVLAFVVAVTRTLGLGSAVRTTLLALAFVALMLCVVRPLLQFLAQRRAPNVRVGYLHMGTALLLLWGSSAVSDAIGIHSLFGAFALGVVLPKEGSLSASLAAKLQGPVLLLMPLFFAYSGLRTQVALVSRPRELAVLAALIALATLGKFGGSAAAARLTGLSWREASAIGILMNTRGLMELIVLNIGMDLGVISPTIFAMLVLMALVTTCATTPLLIWLYPDQERQRVASVAPLGAEEELRTGA